jgi:hypothetical protein
MIEEPRLEHIGRWVYPHFTARAGAGGTHHEGVIVAPVIV